MVVKAPQSKGCSGEHLSLSQLDWWAEVLGYQLLPRSGNVLQKPRKVQWSYWVFICVLSRVNQTEVQDKENKC